MLRDLHTRLAALALLAAVSTGASPARAQVQEQSYLRETPGQSGEDARVSKVIEDAEKHFKLGKLNLDGNKRQAAREEFDRAVDVVLESGMDVRSNPRLSRYYLELVDRIHRLETPSAAPARRPDAGQVGFAEQKFEPSPLDALRTLELDRKESDAAAGLGGKGCDEGAADRIELRGFKLGMTVAEVRARVPNLRLRAADKFNFTDYQTFVRSDRYLSQAALLRGVRAISFEFVDSRVSGIYFVYEDSEKWESGGAFAAQVSSALGLKTRWVRYEGGRASALDDLSYAVCRDSLLLAGLGRFTHERLPVVYVKDLAAQTLLARRRQAEADRRREAEEKRRRAFKP